MILYSKEKWRTVCENLYEDYPYLLKASSGYSQYLNSCFIHFSWALTTYGWHFDRILFRPILNSILDAYKPYFSGHSELKWNIPHAEKTIVERELLRIYSVFESWGGKSPFWKKYSPRYC